MKIRTLILSLTVFIAATSFVIQDRWTMDKNHSELTFEVEHLGVSEVSGHFLDFNVDLKASATDFSDMVVKFTAQSKSINTRVPMRDDHLKSPDFFDVERFPTIEFVSTKIEKKEKDEFIVTGNLTLLGVTKEVKMELEFNGTAENPMDKKLTAGFKVEGKIKRSDFNLGSKFTPPLISDEVEIELNAEFTK